MCLSILRFYEHNFPSSGSARIPNFTPLTSTQVNIIKMRKLCLKGVLSNCVHPKNWLHSKESQWRRPKISKLCGSTIRDICMHEWNCSITSPPKSQFFGTRVLCVSCGGVIMPILKPSKSGEICCFGHAYRYRSCTHTTTILRLSARSKSQSTPWTGNFIRALC